MRKTLLWIAILTGTVAGQTADPAGRVYVYQGRIPGVRPNPIFLDGVEIASLKHRWSYFVATLEPGEHEFRGRHKENAVILYVLPGEDYYFRLDQITSWPGAEKLVRETAAEGRAIVESGKLKPVDTQDIADHKRVK